VHIKDGHGINRFQVNANKQIEIKSIMAGFGANIGDAFIDHAADRFVNDFVPGNGMYMFLE
jgi:hypothetical protein